MSTYTGWRGRVAVASAPIGDRRKAVPTKCTAEWTPERKELCLELFALGLSASAIADRLGGVTRNSVLGMVHREREAATKRGDKSAATALRRTGNLTHLGGTKRQRKARIYKKQPLKPRFANIGNPALRQLYLGDAEPYTPLAEELVIPVNERKTIETLTDSCCRWPIGDPQKKDFHFCGRTKIAGLPYCDFHARRAYQPPQPQRSAAPYNTPGVSSLHFQSNPQHRMYVADPRTLEKEDA